MNSKNIFPLIVPCTYIGPSWDLPHQKFPNSEYVLTWVEINGLITMHYINTPEYNELNLTVPNWQQQAFENLRNGSDYFHTDVTYSKQNNKIVSISFLNDDGIGSRRVLLNVELSKAFPRGYYLAFPDRSCGLVISKDITDMELDESRSMVKNMHKTATTPMSDEIYEPEEFTLPNDCTTPIDKEFSQQLINVIINPD